MWTNLIKKLTLPSLIIWLVPFIISFFFYNQSGELVANFWVFHITMIVVSAATAFVVLRTFFRDNVKVGFIEASAVIILYQLLLDIIVLIGLLSMSFTEYLLTVAPLYFVFIPLTMYFLSSIQRKKTSK